jgi:hypothetical protein
MVVMWVNMHAMFQEVVEWKVLVDGEIFIITSVDLINATKLPISKCRCSNGNHLTAMMLHLRFTEVYYSQCYDVQIDMIS